VKGIVQYCVNIMAVGYTEWFSRKREYCGRR